MRVPLTALALAALLVPAACGDEDGSPSTAETSPAATSTTDHVESTAEELTTTTGFGGGGGPGRAPDPEDVVQAVLVDGDCGRFVTDAFIAQAYGNRQGCEQAVAGGGTADSLDVRSVQRHEDGAVAVVVPEGGPSDGERLRVGLVPDEGVGWKVDSLRSNVPVGP